jgi:hypothetical protein
MPPGLELAFPAGWVAVVVGLVEGGRGVPDGEVPFPPEVLSGGGWPSCRLLSLRPCWSTSAEEAAKKAAPSVKATSSRESFIPAEHSQSEKKCAKPTKSCFDQARQDRGANVCAPPPSQ